MNKTLIVFSHLRWDFVFQRPQQILSRLASSYEIYFFEEPIFREGTAELEITERGPGVHVCRPFTSHRASGFHDQQLPLLKNLLDELVQAREIHEPLVWLYTPMALPLVQQLEPCAVIYDCMDELSAFSNAPRQLLQRENALFKTASLVFTGGPSLYRSKQSRHASVHCFPSSVDRAHFAAARDPALDHPQQREIPHPRLGFYGVIDERLDTALLLALADARPEWQIMLVGPIVKIASSELPRRPNIHYFGQQTYESLPQFLAGWDVCLLPFALNDATRFISPTKMLEYMAAGKPIVSTAITDVVVPYGHVVSVADGPAAFIAACEAALRETAPQTRARISAMNAAVAATSWDRTAESMRALIDDAVRAQPAATESLALPSPVGSHEHSTIVLGAGPTGLSAAFHLGDDYLLLEQNNSVGGWCRSVHEGGFTFDYAGHIMFSNDPYVHKLYDLLLGDNVHWQDREAWIYSNDVFTRYPFQGALYGLPPDVLTECIVGAIEARFGSLKNEPAKATTRVVGSSPSACKAESITDCCADGIAESTAPLGLSKHREATAELRSAEPRNFEEFIYKVWGKGVAKHFALPYNRKLWAVPLEEMETSWLGGRVPMPDLEQMIQGALQPAPKPMGPNARFGYPYRGGFQALVDGFLPHLRGKVKLGARITRVVPSLHEVVLSNGATYSYKNLISTLPLPALIAMIGSEAPLYVQEAAAHLRHVSVRCVNLGIGREALTDKHWIYYPGDTVFHRIFVQGNASPECNPPGGFGLTCEITYSQYKPLPCDGEALIDRCIADCIRVGLIRADDAVLVRQQVDMPYAYVVYDHGRAKRVDTIRQWLLAQDIELAGRYSEWEYYNSDHAFIAGKRAAERVLADSTVQVVPRALLTSETSSVASRNL